VPRDLVLAQALDEFGLGSRVRKFGGLAKLLELIVSLFFEAVVRLLLASLLLATAVRAFQKREHRVDEDPNIV